MTPGFTSDDTMAIYIVAMACFYLLNMGVAKVEDFAADGRLSARNANAHKIVMTNKGLVKAL